MTTWDADTGRYIPPSKTWKIDIDQIVGRGDLPDAWLSRPGGEYFLGASFHFAPYNFPSGSGYSASRMSYAPSPFFLHYSQDHFNSWNVMASTKRGLGLKEYWDWLPGIFIVDESVKYTLPSEERFAKVATDLETGRESRIFGLFLPTNLVGVGCRMDADLIEFGHTFGHTRHPVFLLVLRKYSRTRGSHPARRAWIENASSA